MLIAGVQMDVAFADVPANLAKMQDRLRAAASHGANLVVFPECSATGYCFASLDEARAVAQPLTGSIVSSMVDHCRDYHLHAIFGLIERDGEKVFNVAVLTGPNGLLGAYRKVHLPFLGLDQFSTPGDQPFAVHDAAGVRVGMSICYDSAFPETGRCLSLLGADLLALPTNWPPGAETIADYVVNARAVENGVYFIAVNRVGTERGFRFIGKSKIVNPSGNTLAEARHTEEEILYAKIDPPLARNKHVVRVPGKHEIDRFADRRPEFYSPLTAPHSLRPPGRTPLPAV